MGGYPIASLGDLTLHLVHYKTVEEAEASWIRRVPRIDGEHMFLLMNDRNDCTYEDLQHFEALPYENKVVFTHREYPELKSAFYLPGSENDDFVKPTMNFMRQFGIYRYYDQFDFVHWFNTGEAKRSEHYLKR